MSYKRELPSLEESVNYQLPDNHWLQAVRVATRNLDKVARPDIDWWIQSLHLINGEGKLVCDCDVHPSTTMVGPVAKIPPDWIGLYCESSQDYLRKHIGHLIARSTPA